MDSFKPNIDHTDGNNLQIAITKQKALNNENKEIKEKENWQPNETVSSTRTNVADSKIVVLNYDTGRPINNNRHSYYKPETIILHKLNISYEDVFKTFKEKLMSKIVNGKYVMNNKDAINLDKMIGLACIAMNESENNNKLLRMRNEILETKCVNYDSVVKERDRLKSELDKVIIDLCLALGRKVNNKEDVMHLTNICATLYAQQNEYRYVLIENNNLKHTLNKQLTDIRMETLNNYDEILNGLERFKEEVFIKDLKLSQIMDDMCLIKAENKEKSNVIQLLEEQFAEFSNEFVDSDTGSVFHDSQNNNELNEGKSLIVEYINDHKESNIEVERYRLPVLIDMLINICSNKEDHLKTINRCMDEQNQQLIKEIDDHKEWQKHLENENEKQYSEIENYKRVQTVFMDKESRYNNLREDYSKMHCMYDELCKTHTVSKTIIDNYQQLLTEKETRCTDSDNLIKTLERNLTELTNRFEEAKSMYNHEREKHRGAETNMQQMVEEYTAAVHEKNIEIASMREECSVLNDHIGSTEAEMKNLKHVICNLEYELNDKTKTLRETLKKLDKLQVHTAETSTLRFNELLYNLSKLDQHMGTVLSSMYVCKKQIGNYWNILCNVRNAIQRQSKIRNYLLCKRNNINAVKRQKTSNPVEENKIILLEHRNEIECLKQKHNLYVTRSTNTEVNLKNEIRDLKVNLKLKSSRMIVVEKIASSQLKEASNIIRHLTRIATTQSLELNELKSRNSETYNVTRLLNVIDRKTLQLKCMTDIIQKLKLKNKAMKNLCQIRGEKNNPLKTNSGLCTKYKMTF